MCSIIGDLWGRSQNINEDTTVETEYSRVASEVTRTVISNRGKIIAIQRAIGEMRTDITDLRADVTDVSVLLGFVQRELLALRQAAQAAA